MAEALKNQFGAEVPRTIAAMVRAVYPAFDGEGFVKTVLEGYQSLELMQRGQKIAQGLHEFLPKDYPKALAILMNSLEQAHDRDMGQSLGSFLFLPHTQFVASYGLAHFELSMRALHTLTQRFTAEFSIRPFLAQQPQATLRQLECWAQDPSPHVRRLVSEGTRARLPWAPRLRAFQKDPAPVLALLERLKDDPELYVRRSVANNLNDIGKDHPQLLADTAQRWLQGASAQRRWLVGHALRSAVKRGEPGALQVLGFGKTAKVLVRAAQVTPTRARVGGRVDIAFEVHNPHSRAQRVLVDCCVHYVKANGQTSAKVFKLKTLELAGGDTVPLRKRLSLAQLSTRKHYAGVHRVEVLINGRAQALGSFELLPALAQRAEP
ncbi:MAG: DNA alkylation repair protein [Rhodoferax sp.]|nr:DNA alkylation repair protein [Rhodoferax sp.]